MDARIKILQKLVIVPHYKVKEVKKKLVKEVNKKKWKNNKKAIECTNRK